MTIGLVPGRRRVSKYGLVPQVAGLDSKTAAVQLADLLMELAMASRRQEAELAKSSDPNAAQMGEAAGVVSTASARAAQAAINLSQVNAILVGSSGVLGGRFSLTFSGVAGQILTSTILDSRLTANSVGFCHYEGAGGSLYYASFQPSQSLPPVAGQITFFVYNSGAPANTYPFSWTAAP